MPIRVAALGECMVEIRHIETDLARFSYGGDVLNTAIYLTRLGVPTRFVTALGDDPYSQRMIAEWRAEGLPTDAVRIMRDRLPAIYVIETAPSGERSFRYWRADSPARDVFTAENAAETAKALADADYVFLSGITLSLYGAAGLLRLFGALKQAKARGAKVVFDTNFRPRNWADKSLPRLAYDEVGALADIVLAGEEDLDMLFGDGGAEAKLRAWLPFERAEIVLKCGGAPSRLWKDGRYWEAPPARVAHVVDTTAAGDSFAAGYLAGRLRGDAPDAAAHAGHLLAATVIQHRGAIIPLAAMPRTALASETPR